MRSSFTVHIVAVRGQTGGMKCSGRLALVILLSGCVSLFARDAEKAGDAARQEKATSGELYEAIKRMDAAVFDALNAHDLAPLMAMLTEDLKFYDDGSTEGSGPKSYAQVKKDFVQVFANVPDLRRELVPGSLEVYPLQGYGAIEVGAHRFCHEENGKRDCGTMKFSMVWRKVGEEWKLARVLSCAH